MHRLAHATQGVRQNLEDMRFHDVADYLYKFTWHEFCDWYLELAKVHLYSDQAEEVEETAATLMYVYHRLLALLHPVTPFVTEKIWQHMHFHRQAKHLMVENFPTVDQTHLDFQDEAFGQLRDLIGAIRTIRSENQIPPAKKIDIHLWNVKNPERQAFMQAQARYLQTLAGLDQIMFEAPPSKDNHAYGVVKATEFSFSLEGLIDREAELARLEKQHDKILKDIAHFENKMSNADFVSKAPAALIDKTKKSLELAREQKQKMDAQRAKLEQ
jgi:valyl-tRNA synthetase